MIRSVNMRNVQHVIENLVPANCRYDHFTLPGIVADDVGRVAIGKAASDLGGATIRITGDSQYHACKTYDSTDWEAV